MIRRLQEAEINRVAQIWLETNIDAHYFISEQYWKDNFQSVREMLSCAEVYVYAEENKNMIEGFIGLHDEYIAGIFVCSEAQCGGIGRQLLNFVKGIKKQLRLSVYQKNTRAINFYLREEFRIQCENIDENTKEKEYSMVWKSMVQ